MIYKLKTKAINNSQQTENTFENKGQLLNEILAGGLNIS